MAYYAYCMRFWNDLPEKDIIEDLCIENLADEWSLYEVRAATSVFRALRRDLPDNEWRALTHRFDLHPRLADFTL